MINNLKFLNKCRYLAPTVRQLGPSALKDLWSRVSTLATGRRFCSASHPRRWSTSGLASIGTHLTSQQASNSSSRPQVTASRLVAAPALDSTSTRTSHGARATRAIHSRTNHSLSPTRPTLTSRSWKWFLFASIFTPIAIFYYYWYNLPSHRHLFVLCFSSTPQMVTIYIYIYNIES